MAPVSKLLNNAFIKIYLSYLDDNGCTATLQAVSVIQQDRVIVLKYIQLSEFENTSK